MYNVVRLGNTREHRAGASVRADIWKGKYFPLPSLSLGSFTVRGINTDPASVYRLIILRWRSDGEGGGSFSLVNATRNLRAGNFPFTVSGITRGFYSFQVARDTPLGRLTEETFISNHGYEGMSLPVL